MKVYHLRSCTSSSFKKFGISDSAWLSNESAKTFTCKEGTKFCIYISKVHWRVMITKISADSCSFQSIRSKRNSRQWVGWIHLQALHKLINKKVPLLFCKLEQGSLFIWQQWQVSMEVVIDWQNEKNKPSQIVGTKQWRFAIIFTNNDVLWCT